MKGTYSTLCTTKKKAEKSKIDNTDGFTVKQFEQLLKLGWN